MNVRRERVYLISPRIPVSARYGRLLYLMGLVIVQVRDLHTGPGSSTSGLIRVISNKDECGGPTVFSVRLNNTPFLLQLALHDIYL